jgi:alpha-2-macroglobulin-like protein
VKSARDMRCDEVVTMRRRERGNDRAVWLAVFAAGVAGACSSAMSPAEMGANAKMGAADMAMGPPGQYPQAAALAMPAAMAPPMNAPAAGQDELAREAVGRLAARGDLAGARQFPIPDYSKPYNGPRNDFRETVYWNPSLKTDKNGRATVKFYLSDSITSFRTTAQGVGGGKVGIGSSLVASKRPVSIDVRLPLEVSRGDRIELPIGLENTTRRAQTVSLATRFGPAFSVVKAASADIQLAPLEKKTTYVLLEVVGNGHNAADGAVAVSASAGNIRDALERTIKVVPLGYPGEASASGTLSTSAKVAVDIPTFIADTLEAKVAFYPSPTTQLMAGTEAMIAEPSGCFEQASSTNYPNVMVLGYLRENKVAASPVEADARAKLERGYGLLTGYEAKSKGFEWFGADPGHEALTAYGVMQFVDMAKVYENMDKDLVGRTVSWLKSRRDGKGGFKRNPQALDSFGAAGEEVTNAYITFALTEAGAASDLGAELDLAKRTAEATKDPYVLALSAGALANSNAGGDATKTALDKLAGLQDKDGKWSGAKESITRSGGKALDIETTALATIALMKTKTHPGQVQKAIAWIQQQNEGGGFGSTQATVLALKALTRAASGSGTMPSGTIEVATGAKKRTVTFDEKASDPPEIANFASDLMTGKNTIAVASQSDMKGLPFSVDVTYRTTLPPSSPKAAIHVTTTPRSTSVKTGSSLTMQVVVENTKSEGQPMVIARIGVPGGLTHQKWQLEELVKKKQVDFYETREREVIVYFRAMSANQKKTFDLNLMANVPGTFTAPASQTYLYYTDEFRHFAAPVTVTVTR